MKDNKTKSNSFYSKIARAPQWLQEFWATTLKDVGRTNQGRKDFIETIAAVDGSNFSTPAISFYKKQYLERKKGTTDGWQSYAKFIKNNGQQLGDELIRQKAVGIKKDARLLPDTQVRFPHDSLFYQVEEAGSSMNVAVEGSAMSSTAEASEASVAAYSDLMAQFMDASAGGQGETPDEGEQLVAVDESLQPADPVKLKAAMKAAAQAHRTWDAKGTDFDFILKKKTRVRNRPVAQSMNGGSKH